MNCDDCHERKEQGAMKTQYVIWGFKRGYHEEYDLSCDLKETGIGTKSIAYCWGKDKSNH